MTITKVLMPPDVVLSNNMIPVQVVTDKYLLALGTKQQLRITFTDNTTAGKIITFSWEEFDMVMTFSASPDDTGTQLPLYDHTLITGFDDLIAAFRANYYLTEYYTLATSITGSVGNYQCQLTWTQKNFNQEFTASALTGNDASKYTPTLLTAKVPSSYSANYKALCDVHWQNNPSGAREFRAIARMDATPDATSLAEFDLQEIFSTWQELQPDMPVPSTSTDIEECSGVLKNYYLTLAESYGSNAFAKANVTEPGTIAANTFLQVIKGGLPYLQYPGNTFFDDYCDASVVKFLTNQVSGRTTVSPTQKHWLYFYLKSSTATLKVKYTLYMSDGSTDTGYVYTSGGTANRNVFRAAVGYTQLGLDTIPVSPVEPVKYEVEIVNNANTPITEKFTFWLDIRYYEYNNYLYFHNALGGVDSVWLTGIMLPNHEATGSELLMKAESDYTQGNYKSVNSTTRLGWEFNTGPKTDKNEIELLKELLQSNDVLWLPDTKIKAGYADGLRIIIDKGSVKDWPVDTNNLHQLTFKAREAHLEWE